MTRSIFAWLKITHLTSFFQRPPDVSRAGRGSGLSRQAPKSFPGPAASCSSGSRSFPRLGCSCHPSLTGPVTPSYGLKPCPATTFQGFSLKNPAPLTKSKGISAVEVLHRHRPQSRCGSGAEQAGSVPSPCRGHGPFLGKVGSTPPP